MADKAVPTNCPQWALRIYDGIAVAMLAVAGLAVATGGAGSAPTAAGLDRDWADFAQAAILPAVLLFSFWLGRRRALRDYDEYLLRLIGHAASIGVIATVLAWSSWSILAEGWVAPMTAEQAIGVLLGSTALGYGLARLRDAF